MTVKADQQSLKEANLLSKFNIQYKHQCNVGSAACKAKGIRIPDSEKFCFWNAESGKILLVESRTMGFGIRNTAQGIHNHTNDWNPEIQVPPTRDWNCRPGIRNPESMA